MVLRLFALLLMPVLTPLTAGAETALTVEIVRAARGSDQLWTELTGTIEAQDSFTVAFRQGGRVEAIAADVGDEVAQGALLAQLDPAQAEAALREAEATLAAAEADLIQAAQVRDRSRALLARGAGTNAGAESAEASYIAAGAARDQAKAALATAQQGLADTGIRAPVAGIVTRRSAEPGQVVGAAQPVLTIAPEGRREAVFYAPNTTLLEDLVGQTVGITLLDYPDVHLSAVISEVSPLADAGTGTVRVRASLSGEGAGAPGLLGTPVTSRIALDLPGMIALPWTALVVEEGEPAVWVVDPESRAVSLRPVQIARYTTRTVELTGGVSEGEEVVGAGAHLLYPGRRVTAAEAAQ